MAIEIIASPANGGTATVETNGGGIISDITRGVTISGSFTNYKFTATPAPGFVFSGWSVEVEYYFPQDEDGEDYIVYDRYYTDNPHYGREGTPYNAYDDFEPGRGDQEFRADYLDYQGTRFRYARNAIKSVTAIFIRAERTHRIVRNDYGYIIHADASGHIVRDD